MKIDGRSVKAQTPLFSRVASTLDRIVEREPRRARRSLWVPAKGVTSLFARRGVGEFPDKLGEA